MSQSPALRFLPAGGTALLIETEGLAHARALFEALRADPPEGIIDLIPAAQSLLVQFDATRTDAARLRAAISPLDLTPKARAKGREIVIPLRYDGADLAEVAGLLGLSVPDLIARHQAARFTAAFTGFAPGFAYLTCSDPGLQVPRRQSPRVRIPAGSVALAGAFGGVYPSDSPGGWQILGTTPLAMWDLSRSPAALIAPGDQVRFVDLDQAPHLAPPPAPPAPAAPPPKGTPVARILRADRPVLFQDAGRPGRAAEGVSPSGAMDRGALRAANRAVGNPPDSPGLEVCFGGITLEALAPLTFALTGAPCPTRIRGADGRTHSAEAPGLIALNPGEQLLIGSPPAGLYSYLALRGGYETTPVLGSASYDNLAKLGPAPLGAGDALWAAGARAGAVSAPQCPALPASGEDVTLDLIPGPRDDWFTAEALAALTQQPWEITAESSRTGKRLCGAKPLSRALTGELPSEGTVRGALQVPASGQPVLFLSDHPLTGGYPVVGVIAPHHLDLAAQIPPGARVRFRLQRNPLGKTEP